VTDVAAVPGVAVAAAAVGVEVATTEVEVATVTVDVGVAAPGVAVTDVDVAAAAVDVATAAAVDVADAATDVAAAAVDVAATLVEVNAGAVVAVAVAGTGDVVVVPVAVGGVVAVAVAGTEVGVAVEAAAPPVGVDVALTELTHGEAVTELESSVTAPLAANALPSTTACVASVMLVRARMLPAKAVEVPSVAELPFCQKTWQLCAPLRSNTLDALAVVRALPIWKIKTEPGSP
jgi:hypothetical protein